MQEYLWDGVKRDRLVWLGDMHPEVMTVQSVFGGNAKKLELVDNIICPFPNAQPKHGYAVTFKTENDELKYLRLFVIDYTLTDDGAIATVTVQYQLY